MATETASYKRYDSNEWPSGTSGLQKKEMNKLLRRGFTPEQIAQFKAQDKWKANAYDSGEGKAFATE